MRATGRFFEALDVEIRAPRRLHQLRGVKGEHALASPQQVDLRVRRDYALRRAGECRAEQELFLLFILHGEPEGAFAIVGEERTARDEPREVAFIEAGDAHQAKAHGSRLFDAADENPSITIPL